MRKVYMVQEFCAGRWWDVGGFEDKAAAFAYAARFRLSRVTSKGRVVKP